MSFTKAAVGASLLCVLHLVAMLSSALAAEAKIVKVIDGDTFTADLHVGFDIVLSGQTVRIYGFDAWELSRARRTVNVTDAEIAKGKSAKIALEQLLRGAERVEVREVMGRDPFGRRLLEVYADGKEVGRTMRDKGHERKDQE